jgi:hypothetical protein
MKTIARENTQKFIREATKIPGDLEKDIGIVVRGMIDRLNDELDELEVYSNFKFRMDKSAESKLEKQLSDFIEDLAIEKFQ